MLNRRGGFIAGHEIISAIRERQQWIADEQRPPYIAEHTWIILGVIYSLILLGIYLLY